MSRPFRQHFVQKRNYYIALISEWIAPLLRSLAYLVTGSPSSPQSWRRVLILGSTHIGDVLYTTAGLALLRQGLPHCRISYLAAPPADQVLQRNPNLDEIITVAHECNISDYFRCVYPRLKGRDFDAVLCSARGGAWRELLLALWLKIPNRVGYDFRGFSGWITHPITIRFPNPFAVYFTEFAVELTGARATPSSRPQVFIGEEDREEAEKVWGEFDQSRTKPALLCFATNRQNPLIWPEDNITETLRILQLDYDLALAGAQSDLYILKRIQSRLSNQTPIWAGQLKLRALAFLMTKFQAVITPDSGPRHLANCSSVPVFFTRHIFIRHAEAGVYCSNEYDLMAPSDEQLTTPEVVDRWKKISPSQLAHQITTILQHLPKDKASLSQ